MKKSTIENNNYTPSNTRKTTLLHNTAPNIVSAYFAFKYKKSILMSMLKINKSLSDKKKLATDKWRKKNRYFDYGTFYALNENSVIFDLGGYVGEWSSKLIDRYDCHAFIFEPVKAYSQIISDRFKNKPKVKSLCFGLEGETKDAKISVSNDSSTIFSETDTDSEVIKFVEAKKFIVENQIGQVDVMKINIEGGEYELLEHLIKDKLITKFNNIQIQFHDIPEINSDERMKNIQNELQKTHKIKWQFYPYVWECWSLK